MQISTDNGNNNLANARCHARDRTRHLRSTLIVIVPLIAVPALSVSAQQTVSPQQNYADGVAGAKAWSTLGKYVLQNKTNRNIFDPFMLIWARKRAFLPPDQCPSTPEPGYTAQFVTICKEAYAIWAEGFRRSNASRDYKRGWYEGEQREQ